MTATDALGGQYTRTVHRGVSVLMPTSVYQREVQPHIDRGDHAAAADAVLAHVTGYREDRPQENAVGRYGGIGVHWSSRRYTETNEYGRHTTGASTFAGIGRGGRETTVARDADELTGDHMLVPVLMRGVVHPENIDTEPPKHRVVFDPSIEAEVHVRSGAPISVRSAHVYLPDRVPETEDLGIGLHHGQGAGEARGPQSDEELGQRAPAVVGRDGDHHAVRGLRRSRQGAR